jgi:hypothetical protein
MSVEIPVSKRLYMVLENEGKELGLTPEGYLQRIVHHATEQKVAQVKPPTTMLARRGKQH